MKIINLNKAKVSYFQPCLMLKFLITHNIIVSPFRILQCFSFVWTQFAVSTSGKSTPGESAPAPFEALSCKCPHTDSRLLHIAIDSEKELSVSCAKAFLNESQGRKKLHLARSVNIMNIFV